MLLLHGGFWLSNLMLLLLILGALSQGDVVEDSDASYFLKVAIGVVAIPALVSFYGFYYYLFPRYLEKRKLSLSIVSGVFVSALSALIGMVALYFLLDLVYSCYQESNFIAIPIMVLIGMIYGTIAVIIRGFITWYEELKVKEALLEKNHQMELALVKSQLDPHFLFNTINNIDILIVKDAEKASSYLNRLSGIMRFMLFETKAERIPLAKEIEYIEKYIELQRLRTANANYINYSLIGQTNGRNIAPMVFIPFIENACKHATNKKIEDAISIEISISPKQVELKCENKFDRHRKPQGKDHGLGNELIQKRLNLIYPTQHELSALKKDDVYSVHLIIKHE